MIRSLAFVPLQDLDAAYDELLMHIDIGVWGPYLHNYFEPWYIGVRNNFGPGRRDGIFKREIWNVYQRTLEGKLF
jgi:hypothetical protein